ncbi:dTDP-4-dehydrorhamnose reductase [Hazenella coriacea]|uniref:dTDP-4-dehydrorhamnose reductase n=1 Tax=Hazenella coriacea TaxID=1179467 RepID=A0A4R3L4X9_9BACL|nr:dTDP-4-dehydrorhamnose reductase [Hazenella coriacea]TCS93830.1 dTDP-4-dehydrorhamnose reductase [Hazenella coriacea]
MKIVVTGATGQLGREMVLYFSKKDGYQVIGFPKEDWDVTQAHQAIEILDREQPDVLIHCAAFTDVDQSEENAKIAFRVNGKGSRLLATHCQQRQIRMVYISTHYVFDGQKEVGYTEEDLPNPINQYGRSKILGETWVSQLCSRHLIIRTSWLFGIHGDNFVRTILRKIKQREALSISNDRVGSPTYTRHLIQQIDRLLQTDAVGIFHITNRGSCTRYQFAKRICEMANLNYPIQPIKAKVLRQKAVRPRYSVLLSPRREELGLPELPHWKEGVQDFLKSIRSI